MLNKIKRSFLKEDELKGSNERRSYLNVRDFLDELEVKSTVSTAQSEIFPNNRLKKTKKPRKKNILELLGFERDSQNKDDTIYHPRSVSMVKIIYL